jgi:thymidylate synthase ThyX
MEYSEDDKKILNYFFTNLDKPIFAAKNFHPEVWALMQARYSRSREGLRESFLKLLKEDSRNFEILKQEIDKTSGGKATRHATEKAIQFMERWVLGFGHSSVAEGAVVGLALEGVSILATKVIENCRLCSFIEKSTRYVSFDNKSFYIDEDLKNSEFYPEIKELLELLFKTYMELHEPVLEYVKKVAPKDPKTPLPAWERACASRRFDAVRYLLPICTKTSLGWTVNARQLAHGISKLLSHPLKEMNEIGEMIKVEASKVLPSLLRYADRNNYFVETEKSMDEISPAIEIEDGNSEPVTLVKGPSDADDIIVASILYRYKRQPMSKIIEKVKQMTKEEKEKILDIYLGKMGRFDYPMRELEHAQFLFDIIIDYGAFRDLQRHRICTQTNQIITTNLGYAVPKDIVDAGGEEKFRKAMEKAKEVYEKVAEKYPLQSQYLLPLGFKKRYICSMNLREIYHLVKLRTIPLAHESYRKIAYLIYEQMKEKYPLLSKYIECNYTEEELGRLKSEEKTEKLEGVGPL